MGVMARSLQTSDPKAQELFVTGLVAKPAELVLERCKGYLVSPPAAGWDGTVVYHTKG